MSGFSYYYTGGCGGYPNDHQGLEKYAVDFGLINTEVDAAAYGQVGAIGFTSAGGEYVWIMHPNNVQTYYGHLSTAPGAIYVSLHQWVYKGQAIAKSDTSGQALGPHLHFRVSTGGTGPFTGTGIKPEPMSGTAPPGYIGWDRYGCAGDSSTEFISTPPLEQVAVAARPLSAEDLLLRGTDGSIYHAPTDIRGTPLYWQDLLGGFKGTPCGVWDASGTRLDVFGIGLDDHPWRNTSTDGAQTWGGWVQQTGLSGSSETESVTCTRRPNGIVDLFMRGPSGDGLHGYTDSSGNIVAWDSLGGIVKGAPSGAWNALQTRLDIYAIGNDDHPYHGVCTTNGGPCAPSSWSGWTDRFSGSAGSTEDELISVIRRPDGTMDVFLLATNWAGYHGPTDANGVILTWESLGGVIKGAPSAKWDPDQTRLDVFAVGINDQLYQITWTSLGWGPWGSLSGGEVAA